MEGALAAATALPAWWMTKISQDPLVAEVIFPSAVKSQSPQQGNADARVTARIALLWADPQERTPASPELVQ
jgi:hypothetical protein